MQLASVQTSCFGEPSVVMMTDASVEDAPPAVGFDGGVKIGGLWKRSQGLSKFTKANFKHRVFILTDHSLSYYSGTVDRVGQLKGRVSVDSIRAVEFVDETAFNLAHTLQVVYFSKKNGFVPLYITARDKLQCTDWVASIRQVCYFKQDLLMHYHPGALRKNTWSCCKQCGKTTLGCKPTYHLLTRSSSRYAQIRRKDTLTSSSGRTRGHSQAKPLGGGAGGLLGGGGGEIERSSAIEDSTHSGHSETVVVSNSYMELPPQPPNTEEGVCGTANSTNSTPRNSIGSNDASVGLASVSVTSVALNPLLLNGSASHFELEAGSKTSSSSFSGSNKKVRSAREGSSTPRNSTRLSGSSFAPSVAPSSSISIGPSSTPPLASSVVSIVENRDTPALRHSKTFYVSPLKNVCQPPQQLFHSLPRRPTIAPRISNSDPTVIHV